MQFLDPKNAVMLKRLIKAKCFLPIFHSIIGTMDWMLARVDDSFTEEFYMQLSVEFSGNPVRNYERTQTSWDYDHLRSYLVGKYKLYHEESILQTGNS